MGNYQNILTIHVPLTIGFFGGHKLSFRINIKEFKKYFDLSEEAIIDYACKINSNYLSFNQKYQTINIKKSYLAAKYQQLIKDKECKNYSDLASKMGVSRQWITKVMKHLVVVDE